MKKIFALSASLAILGCAEGQPYTERFFLKQGVTYDQYQRDALDCANAATAAAPAAQRIGWVPYVGVYSVDQNAGLRQANLDVCLRDKGYSFTEVPQCLPDQWREIRETGFGRREALNQRLDIRPDSCFSRFEGQTFFKA